MTATTIDTEEEMATEVLIASLKAKLVAAEKAAGRWKSEAEKFACAYDNEDRRVDDLMSALEQRAERAEAERDALVARCAVLTGATRAVNWHRDDCICAACEVLRNPDPASEELLKDRRRLDWFEDYHAEEGRWILKGDGTFRAAIDRAMQEGAQSNG